MTQLRKCLVHFCSTEPHGHFEEFTQNSHASYLQVSRPMTLNKQLPWTGVWASLPVVWVTFRFNYSGENAWINSVQHCLTNSIKSKQGSAHASRYVMWRKLCVSSEVRSCKWFAESVDIASFVRSLSFLPAGLCVSDCPALTACPQVLPQVIACLAKTSLVFCVGLWCDLISFFFFFLLFFCNCLWLVSKAPIHIIYLFFFYSTLDVQNWIR